MSPNCGLINTPNLNFCLSSSKTQVQLFKKDVSDSATKDSIMNAHNKTQFTYAKIKCALKDSSCDTPLPKILMLAILATCASSSSTKVLKCPYTKMIPYSHTILQQFIVPKSHTTLTLTKMNTMHDFTHRFALIFQPTIVSAHSR